MKGGMQVDGRIIRTFEEKQLEYEVSIMGQQVASSKVDSGCSQSLQVGMHSATVRLFELPHGEEGNVELKNLSVSYFIAEPGTGWGVLESCMALRKEVSSSGSTGGSLPTLSGGEERMLETARSHITEAGLMVKQGRSSCDGASRLCEDWKEEETWWMLLNT